MTDRIPSLHDFKASLLEAIEWHDYRKPHHQGLPSLLHSGELNPHGSCPPPSDRCRVVDEVVRKRREALHRLRPSSVLREVALRGRLVICDFDSTLSDGAVNVASSGYFDEDNVPAWDTWIAYVPQDTATSPSSWRFYRGYLISWAPPELIPLIDRGIDHNPEACIAWAKDIGTVFGDSLKTAGLLL